MKNKAGNLAVSSNRKLEKTTALGDHSYHGLILALQTTLDIEQLLRLFSEQLQAIFPHSGFGFRNEKLGIELSMGTTGRHACSYYLDLENEPLGEWRMTRDRRFREADLARIEALLCCLLYPLRNALRYHEALWHAHTDQLTQTGNRAALMNGLQRELERARRYDTPLSIILLDIDHFKSINDTFGHDAGDAVLCSVARSIKATVRGSDVLFRYGGEEFVILLSNTPKDGAVNLAERIRGTVETLSSGMRDINLRFTLSLGVATLLPTETHLDLLRRADQVMYTAKRSGRNQVAVAS